MGMQDKIFDVKIPTETVTDIKEGGRRVTSEKKVFPGYILVQMELGDESWYVVRNTPGVTGFVGSQGKPVPLSREEFNRIMKRTEVGAKQKTTTDFVEGMNVKVTSGPFAEFDGTIAEVNLDRATVRVMVTISAARHRSNSVSIRWHQSSKVNARSHRAGSGPELLVVGSFEEDTRARPQTAAVRENKDESEDGREVRRLHRVAIPGGQANRRRRSALRLVSTRSTSCSSARRSMRRLRQEWHHHPRRESSVDESAFDFILKTPPAAV